MTDAEGALVTVLGVRRGRFVDFEYAVGDGMLAVELILPFAALDEFAGTRRARVRFANDDVERAYHAARPHFPVRSESDNHVS